MENVNTVNDVQPSVVETEGLTLESGPEAGQSAEVTDRVQSREENASFRKMRLENERLRAENERLQAGALEARMAEDLAAIRRIEPRVETLEELGQEFADLIAAGISAPVAFCALQEARRASMPPEMGQLQGSGGKEKTFYSPAEVDAMEPSALADPTVWERVRASMTKW